jgi:hypothetical protein
MHAGVSPSLSSSHHHLVRAQQKRRSRAGNCIELKLARTASLFAAGFLIRLARARLICAERNISAGNYQIITSSMVRAASVNGLLGFAAGN